MHSPESTTVSSVNAALASPQPLSSIVISLRDLQRIRQQMEEGIPLAEVAEQLSLDSADTVLAAIAETLGLTVIDLTKTTIDAWRGKPLSGKSPLS